MKKILTLCLTMILAFSLVGCSKTGIKKYSHKVFIEEFNTNLIQVMNRYSNKNYTLDIKTDYYTLEEKQYNGSTIREEITSEHFTTIECDYKLSILNKNYRDNILRNLNGEQVETVFSSNETFQRLDNKFYLFDNEKMTVSETTNINIMYSEYNLNSLWTKAFEFSGDRYIDANVFTLESKKSENSNESEQIMQFVFNDNEIIYINYENKNNKNNDCNFKSKALTKYVYNFSDLTLEPKNLVDYQLV